MQPAAIQRTASLAPQNMNEAFSLAKHAAATGMFGVSSPEQALMVLLRGMELGFGPSTALSAFHVIKGKPVLSADAQVALCLSRRDLCEYFTRTESTETVASYETKRVGTPRPVTLSFTMEEAKAAQLLSNDQWKKYPKAMLRHRAASALARDVYPELLLGIYTPEEMESVSEPARQVTPIRAEVTVTRSDEAPPPLSSDWAKRIEEAKSSAKPGSALAKLGVDLAAAELNGTRAAVLAVYGVAVQGWIRSLPDMSTLEQGVKHFGRTVPESVAAEIRDRVALAFDARKAELTPAVAPTPEREMGEEG